MNDRIVELGKEVKMGIKTWEEVARIINKEFKSDLSSEAVRKRFMRNCDNEEIDNLGKEYTTEYGNGVIEAQKIVEYNKEIFGDMEFSLELIRSWVEKNILKKVHVVIEKET